MSLTEAPAFNVIPNSASARFNVRYNDRWTRKTLKQWIESRLADGTGDSRFSIEYEAGASDVFLTKSNTLIETLASAVQAETGRVPQLSTGGGTSDARFIKNYCPVIEFGLVGQTMHQVDERVAVNDLITLSAIYQRFLELFFQQG